MSDEVLAIVDAVSETPAILLDLHGHSGLRVEKDGFSSPPPPLRRSTVNPLGDGQIITDSSYEAREISINLIVDSDSQGEALEALQRLQRYLDSAGFWLMRRPQGAAAPTFYRAMRSGLSGVKEYGTRADGTRVVEVTLFAEPFGYGLPVSGTFSIGADPTSGGVSYVWPDEVQGDVPAPLQLSFTGYGIASLRWWTSHALRSSDSTSFPLVVDSSAFVKANNTDVTSSTSSSSLFVGGSAVEVASVGANRVGRVDLPSVPAGDYRLFLRGEDLENVHLELFDDAGWFPIRRPVDFSAPTELSWVEFGTVRLPMGQPLVDGALPSWIAAAPLATSLELSTTDSASFTLDAAMLVPAVLDGQVGSTALAVRLDPNEVGSTGLIDGESRSVAIGRPGGKLDDRSKVGVAGLGYPRLAPGARNIIHSFSEVTTDGAGGPPIGSAPLDVTFRYFPRYLYARPALS